MLRNRFFFEHGYSALRAFALRIVMSTVLASMEQSWRRASRLFACGRTAKASDEFDKAVEYLGHSTRNPVLSSVAAVNSAALASEQVYNASRTKSDRALSQRDLSSAESVALSACAQAADTANIDIDAAAFLSEAALTACFNAALLSARSHFLSRSKSFLSYGVSETLRSAQHFVAAMEHELVEFGPARKKRPRREKYATLNSNSELDDGVWQDIRITCEKLRTMIHSGMADFARRPLERWALACSALVELFSAVMLLAKASDRSLLAGHIANDFIKLAASLSDIGAAERSQNGDEDLHRNIIQYSSPKSRRAKQTTNTSVIFVDGAENSNSSGGFEPGNVDSDSDCDKVSSKQFLHGMRGRSLMALAYGMRQEWDNAVAIVRNDALLALSPSENNFQRGDTRRECFWPSVYIAGAVMMRRGERSDSSVAVALLEACALAGYRCADSMALAARQSSEADALNRWQKAMMFDHVRPGGLWSAARIFAEFGEHGSRANLLECLEELLSHEEALSQEGFLSGSKIRNSVVVSLTPRTTSLDTSKVQDQYLSLNANSFVEGNPTRSYPGLQHIRVERARALAATGDLSGASEILKPEALKIQSGELETSPNISYRRNVLRDLAWVLARVGATEECIQMANCAIVHSNTEASKCAGLLCKADAYITQEHVDDALSAATSAFGLINPMASIDHVVNPPKRSLEESKNSVRAAGTLLGANEELDCFLRGICYNNIGVLEMCVGNHQQADRSFNAAEVAFDKSLTHGTKAGWLKEVTKLAKENGNAAVFNRCLLMFRSGRSLQAASYWLGRMKETTDSDTEPFSVDTDSVFVEAEAVAAAASRASSAAESSLDSERVGSAHVLGSLSRAQAEAMTFACMTRQHRERLRRALYTDVDRAGPIVL